MTGEGPGRRRRSFSRYAACLIVAASGFPLFAAPLWAQAPQQTEAERVTSLEALIKADEAWLREVLRERAKIAKEYDRASKEFAEAEVRLAELRVARDTETVQGPDQETVEKIETERRETRDRFDAIIERARALDTQSKTLEAKLELERRLRDDLKSGRRWLSDDEATPTAAEAVAPQETAKDTARAELPLDAAVVEATEALQAAQEKLARNQGLISFLSRAIDVFTADLESARALRDAARQAVEVAQALDEPEREARVSQLTRHEQRVVESERVLSELIEARTQTLNSARAAQDEVDGAERRLSLARSPLAPHRWGDWLTRRGPGIVTILLAMLLVRVVARVLGPPLVRGLVRSSRYGAESARAERVDTLNRVLQSTATLAIVVTGTLAALSHAGVDITVLLGGAAVLGAALAFGSQSLIKDYFSGFMILAENQYSVGNVVAIGDHAGLVEDITLRVTVLRDLEGVVHFVPHSQVNIVRNLTYEWSRVMLDIGVAYKEDVNRVSEVLMELAHGMRDDEKFGPMVIDNPELLGVDAFADSGVVIRFLLKTRPLDRWNVKRELLRRIKARFDELGIEIPVPHRSVYLRGPNSAPELTGSGRE